MTAAARQLDISQSAVSQAVAALERDHGVVLFDRESRPLRLSTAGRALLEQAGALLEHARAVATHIVEVANTGALPVRLGCVDSFASTVGPDLIRAVSGPVRQISLWSGLTPGLSKQLHDRELDLAVCTQTILNDASIVEVPLFSEAFIAVVARSWLEKHPQADWRALMLEMPMIRYTPRSIIGQQVERYARHLGIDSPRQYEFDATDPMLSLVVARLGFAISTPLCLWQARQYLPELAVLPLPVGRLGKRDFFLLHRQGQWDAFAHEIASLTRRVIDGSIRPALMRTLPKLAEDALQ